MNIKEVITIIEKYLLIRPIQTLWAVDDKIFWKSKIFSEPNFPSFVHLNLLIFLLTLYERQMSPFPLTNCCSLLKLTAWKTPPSKQLVFSIDCPHPAWKMEKLIWFKTFHSNKPDLSKFAVKLWIAMVDIPIVCWGGSWDRRITMKRMNVVMVIMATAPSLFKLTDFFSQTSSSSSW